MSENRYENMTKEEILNLAKKGITINNEEERKTFYNCIGLKTDEQKQKMRTKLLIISILVYTLIIITSIKFNFSDTVSLIFVILYLFIALAILAKIDVDWCSEE